jgi:hypothetical protein
VARQEWRRRRESGRRGRVLGFDTRKCWSPMTLGNGQNLPRFLPRNLPRKSITPKASRASNSQQRSECSTSLFMARKAGGGTGEDLGSRRPVCRASNEFGVTAAGKSL